MQGAIPEVLRFNQLFGRNLDSVVGERLLEIVPIDNSVLPLRQRMQFEKHEGIALGIIEGLEAGNLFQRIVGVDIFERARVNIVPGGPPSRLVVGQFGSQIGVLRRLHAEVVAE